MITYKGFKAFYLTLGRWRVTCPDGFQFDVICGNGLPEMIENIERWRKIL